jgi:Berberine and berberine like
MVNVSTPYDPKLWDASAHFLQQGAKLRDQYGLQGYFYIYPNGFHSVLHMPDKFATLTNAQKVTTQIMTEMEKLAGGKHIEPKYYQYKTYKEWYIAEMGDEEMEDNGSQFLSWYDGAWGDCPASADVMMNPTLVLPWKLEEAQRDAAAAKGGKTKRATKVPRTQPMGRTYLDSRLLSDKMVNSVSREQLAKVVGETFPHITANHVRGFLYGGGKMAQSKVADMGLLPAWRDMTYHYIINAVPGGTRHDFNIQLWDKLFPEAGAYINEANPGEPKWKEKFWGVNYPKLEAYKKKIDPTNVLWCSPCVGADLLTYDDERLCKNPNYPQAGPPPQTYKNDNSKTGIASLPGEPGIPNPMAPIIQAWMVNKTLPTSMPRSNYFKMAMGQGGSAGGKWSLGPGDTVAPAAAQGHEGMAMGHMV